MSHLSFLSRLAVTFESSLKGFANPYRGDWIAALAEVTGESACVHMGQKMKLDSVGRRILQERPLIDSTTLDLQKLSNLPSNSFGAVYAQFMVDNQINSDTREPIKYMRPDSELAYIMLRYRQVHDFWHVLTGLPITVFGEVALKWFEYFQTGLPMNAMAALVGPLKLSSTERALLRSHYIPWALANGPRAKFLLNVYYEQCLDKDLTAFRKELGIVPFHVAL